jgi:hypothetical protein
MQTITAKLGTSAAKLVAAHTDENGNATRSMRLYLAGHADYVRVLTTHATGNEVELIIPRGGNVAEYINFAIDAAFVTHDEPETETTDDITDTEEQEDIMEKHVNVIPSAQRYITRHIADSDITLYATEFNHTHDIVATIHRDDFYDNDPHGLHGDIIEVTIPRGTDPSDINDIIRAAFTDTNEEQETIMTTTTETTTARTLTEEEAAAMLAAMADMRAEFGDDFDADELETAAATEHKPRTTRKAYEVAAAKERRKQAEQKLGGRTSMLDSERLEYESGKRPTRKTTRKALLVYEEPGYELSHGIHDTRQYFAHWARSEQRTDMSYLGRFSSDEAAIEYFKHWKRTHRAYIAA